MEYVCVFLKPDAVRDHLEDLILHDLLEITNVSIILQKYVQFTEEKVKIIYPFLMDDPIMPYLVVNYLQDQSLFLIVKGEHAVKLLVKAKGQVWIGGIRKKYCTMHLSTMRELGWSEEVIIQKMTETRIHNTDNMQETITACRLFLSPREIEDLKQLDPLLWSCLDGSGKLLKLT